MIKELSILVLASVASFGTATILNQFWGYHIIGFFFLLMVFLCGLVLSRIPIFILAGFYSIIYSYVFMSPKFSFALERTEDFMMLMMFFISAAIIGHLTSRIRAREKSLEKSEEGALASYHLAKALLSSIGIKEIMEIGAYYFEQTFTYPVFVLYSADGIYESAGNWLNCPLDIGEKEALDWVLINGQPAGKFTQTLSKCKGHYIPLLVREKTYGVIGINSEYINVIDVDQFTAFENFSNQIASALEKENFNLRTKKFEVIELSHKLVGT